MGLKRGKRGERVVTGLSTGQGACAVRSSWRVRTRGLSSPVAPRPCRAFPSATAAQRLSLRWLRPARIPRGSSVDYNPQMRSRLPLPPPAYPGSGLWLWGESGLLCCGKKGLDTAPFMFQILLFWLLPTTEGKTCVLCCVNILSMHLCSYCLFKYIFTLFARFSVGVLLAVFKYKLYIFKSTFSLFLFILWLKTRNLLILTDYKGKYSFLFFLLLQLIWNTSFMGFLFIAGWHNCCQLQCISESYSSTFSKAAFLLI